MIEAYINGLVIGLLFSGIGTVSILIGIILDKREKLKNDKP